MRTEGHAVGFYQNRIMPHLVNWTMRNRQFQPYRERVVSAAEGRVLEIGIGSGLNLAFYPGQVREIVGLEPAERLLGMAREAACRSRLKVTLIEGSAEAIPLERNTIDTVVTTWTLCTIPDPLGALQEMRRVLRSSGQLLFVEHGLAPEEKIRRWQNRLTPVWKRIAGGCHLNRPIRELIENAGFAITQIDTGYMEGPKLMTFFYQGRARPN
jgi:ubiquinone/menaquinone biosynthesis C-methylase UbiE